MVGLKLPRLVRLTALAFCHRERPNLAKKS
jgi:hypothetical protein